MAEPAKIVTGHRPSHSRRRRPGGPTLFSGSPRAPVSTASTASCSKRNPMATQIDAAIKQALVYEPVRIEARAGNTK